MELDLLKGKEYASNAALVCCQDSVLLHGEDNSLPGDRTNNLY